MGAVLDPTSPMGWDRRPVRLGNRIVGFINRAWEAECPFVIKGRLCGLIITAATKGQATRQLRDHNRNEHSEKDDW